MRTFDAGGETVVESDEIISVVWSWTAHHDGDFPDIDHRITWIKDEPALYYETKRPTDNRWISTEIRNDRFRPSNLKQARRMATEFIGGDDA